MRTVFAAGAIALAAAAASCGGESESKSVTAAVGAALPGLERISETGVYDSATSKFVATGCPEGKTLIGAGGRIRAETSPPGWIGTLQSGQVALTRIVPFPSLTGVTVAGAEVVPNTLTNWAVQSYGLCQSQLGQVEQVSAASVNTSGSRKLAQVACPTGKRVVGAGGSIGSPVSDSGKVTLMRISPNGELTDVTVEAKEVGTGTTSDWQAFAYALCAIDGTVPGLEYKFSSTPIDSNNYKYTYVDCPEGKKVAGAAGGIGIVEIGGTSSVVLTGIAIHSGPIPRVSAFAAETGNGTSANWTVRAVAICATP
jgi:hypothetical protein